MNDELSRLLARLSGGEQPPARALLRLRPYLVPRAVWRAVALEGSALTLAEVSAILDGLEGPKATQVLEDGGLEAREIKCRRDAFSLALSAALLERLQGRLRGAAEGSAADESRPGALSELVVAFRTRRPPEAPPSHP